MNSPAEITQAKPGTDRLLLPYLHAVDEFEAEQLLGRLISEHAAPIIEAVIKSKLKVSLNHHDGSHRNQDALEISSDVYVVLTAELRSIRKGSASKTINNFRGYVSSTVYHACAEYLREKFPERTKLKNKLRYFLSHTQGYALWENDEREFLSGFAAWQGNRKANSLSPHQVNELRLSVEAFEHKRSANEQRGERERFAAVLSAVFRLADAPVELDVLVDIMAELLGITDISERDMSDEEATDNLCERLPDKSVSVATMIEQRSYLARLWDEICQLPAPQRAALLLNLRDAHGGDPITLLPRTGVASISKIADALNIPAEEFAHMWNSLPIEDAKIAEMLRVTRQQIINLRKAARERLAHRMQAFECTRV